MNIEEARAVANQKFTKIIQPLLDNPHSHSHDSAKLQREVDRVKEEILQETGHEVKKFFVHPIGFGVYEITTLFSSGETRKRDENEYLFS